MITTVFTAAFIVSLVVSFIVHYPRDDEGGRPRAEDRPTVTWRG